LKQASAPEAPSLYYKHSRAQYTAMQKTQPAMLVTGGSRGIGRAAVEQAISRGYDVCINYAESRATATELVNLAVKNNCRAFAFQANVGNREQVEAMFQAIDSEFGRLDVLVNNAGIVAPPQRLEEITEDRLQSILDINVSGALYCASAAVRRMSTRLGGSGGSIINISSIAAILGGPNEYVDYAMSKGALDSMTSGLAKEVAAEGIRVNAIRPGLIYTDIHASGGEPDRVDRLAHLVPMQRGGTAHEVANAILWLASDEASYVTGSFLNVSGGR